MNRLLQHVGRYVTSDHLETAGMSYTEHLRFSLSVGNQFLYSAAAAYAHAVWPDVLTDSSTRGAKRVQHMLRDKTDEVLLRQHHRRVDAQRALLKALPRPRPHRPHGGGYTGHTGHTGHGPSLDAVPPGSQSPVYKEQFFSYSNTSPFRPLGKASLRDETRRACVRSGIASDSLGERRTKGGLA